MVIRETVQYSFIYSKTELSKQGLPIVQLMDEISMVTVRWILWVVSIHCTATIQ